MRTNISLLLIVILVISTAFAQPNHFMRDYPVLAPGAIGSVDYLNLTQDDIGNMMIGGYCQADDSVDFGGPILLRLNADTYTAEWVRPLLNSHPSVANGDTDIDLNNNLIAAYAQRNTGGGPEFEYAGRLNSEGIPIGINFDSSMINSEVMQVLVEDDGGYVVVSRRQVYHIVVRRYGPSGNIEWTASFECGSWTIFDKFGANIVRHPESGYVLFTHASSQYAEYHPALVFIDDNGAITNEVHLESLWDYYYTYVGCLTPDGGYIVLVNGFYSSTYLFRYNSEFNLIQTVDIGHGWGWRYSLNPTSDNGYLVTLSEEIMYFDGDLNLVWTLPFYEPWDWDIMAYEAVELELGVYAAVGVTHPDSAVVSVMFIGMADPGLPTAQVELYRQVGDLFFLPPDGMEYEYTTRLINNLDGPQTLDLWVEATLPNGSVYPVSNEEITIVDSYTLLNRTLTIPAAAPSGNYTLTARIGVWPNGAISSNTLWFRKAGAARLSRTRMSDYRILAR